MIRVFADTFYFLALTNQRDLAHARSQEPVVTIRNENKVDAPAA